MKLKIKEVLLLAVLFVLFSAFILFITLPKFLLLDRVLMKKGIYLMAQGVEEGLFHVKLSKVQVYDKSLKLAEFDSAEFSIKPFYLSLRGTCQGGSLETRLFLNKKIEIEGKNFGCLRGARVKFVDLELTDGIKGKLELEDLKLRDLKVDGLTVDFKGRTFSGQAKVLNSLVVGDGVVSFNRADPLRSSINGKLTGMGLNLQISGTLQNPSVEVVR
ncbi:hypothetical protein [Thermocrinis sp.]|jgi:hypothetical protein|uniref:hypothetical protein n=1 Tax=Thermocrinis sp. TaxID=2024383 RepID=UPI002635AC69|nr:hypothetical protein [Thermocrinis sp.]